MAQRLEASEKNLSLIQAKDRLYQEKFGKLESSLNASLETLKKHALNESLHNSIGNIKKYTHFTHMQKVKTQTDSAANMFESERIKISRPYINHTICMEGSTNSRLADVIIPKSSSDIAVFLRGIFQQFAYDGNLHSWTFLPGVYEFNVSRPNKSYFCNCGLYLSHSKSWIYTGIDATLRFKDNASAGEYVDSQLPTAVILSSASNMISGFTIDGNLNNNPSYSNIVGGINACLNGNQLTEFCTIKNVHEGIRDVMNFNSISNNRIFAVNTGIKIFNLNSAVTAQAHKISGNFIKNASVGIELDKTSEGSAENLICSNTILFSDYNPDTHKSISVKGGSGNILAGNYCKSQTLDDILPSLDVSAEDVIFKNSSGQFDDSDLL
nr:MAG TPA: hypothetical protein [Caudoviricetes sp.]